MTNLIRVIGAIVLGGLAVGCIPTGEGEWKPVPIDGTGNPQPQPGPAKPTIAPTTPPTIVPTMVPIQEDETNIPGVREVHAAASEADCDAMFKKFKKAGRNLRMRTRKIGDNNSVLPWLCIFEGPDASVDVFNDNRSR